MKHINEFKLNEHIDIPESESIKVIIEIFGGVAECTNKDQLPSNIEVVIIDHDNEDDSFGFKH